MISLFFEPCREIFIAAQLELAVSADYIRVVEEKELERLSLSSETCVENLTQGPEKKIKNYLAIQ